MDRTIRCPDLETFMLVIEQLLAKGLGFRSDAGKLTIELTGAF